VILILHFHHLFPQQVVEVVHILRVMLQVVVDLVVEVKCLLPLEHQEQQIKDLRVVMVYHIQITFILAAAAVVLVDLVEMEYILDLHIQIMHNQELVVLEN